jgi:proliferating cell nuclear antigen
MFEAKILQGALLKKIIEAIRELVVDANLDCNERGITMQVLNFCSLYSLIFD